MNSIEKSNLNLLGASSDIWNHIFSYLSDKRVFFIFPKVSQICANLVKNYHIQFELEEKFWHSRCCENHTSWDRKEVKPLKKGLFFSWKKVYLATEPSFYICKKRKYEQKHSECREKIEELKVRNAYLTMKSYFRQLTKDEQGEQNYKIKLDRELERIDKKKEKLCHESILEKIVVSAIGKNRFNQIPLFEDYLKSKGIKMERDLNILMNYFINDTNCPSIVRGETDVGKKFLFLRPEWIDKKSNTILGRHYRFLFSSEKSLVDAYQSIFFSINGFNLVKTRQPDPLGIKPSTLKILEGLASIGYFEKEDVILRLNFFKSEKLLIL